MDLTAPPNSDNRKLKEAQHEWRSFSLSCKKKTAVQTLNETQQWVSLMIKIIQSHQLCSLSCELIILIDGRGDDEHQILTTSSVIMLLWILKPNTQTSLPCLTMYIIRNHFVIILIQIFSDCSAFLIPDSHYWKANQCVSRPLGCSLFIKLCKHEEFSTPALLS